MAGRVDIQKLQHKEEVMKNKIIDILAIVFAALGDLLAKIAKMPKAIIVVVLLLLMG